MEIQKFEYFENEKSLLDEIKAFFIIIFTSEALLVLKIFNFVSRLFYHVAKRLDKKDTVNFKFYDTQPG